MLGQVYKQIDAKSAIERKRLMNKSKKLRITSRAYIQSISN